MRSSCCEKWTCMASQCNVRFDISIRFCIGLVNTLQTPQLDSAVFWDRCHWIDLRHEYHTSHNVHVRAHRIFGLKLLFHDIYFVCSNFLHFLHNLIVDRVSLPLFSWHSPTKMIKIELYMCLTGYFSSIIILSSTWSCRLVELSAMFSLISSWALS